MVKEKMDALVPTEKQPYSVPENWKWVPLLNSFNNRTDSKKKIKQNDYLIDGKIAIIDQGQEIVGGYTNDDEMKYEGELPVIIFGDHTRRIKYIDFPFVQGADGVKVLVSKSFLLPKAFFYALTNIDIPNMGYRRHFPLFKNFCIPVPPIPEQYRIVDRIESLFAKLDEAKEKAQVVVDGFEERKAAVLHQAFTGKLTAEWRVKEGIPDDSWQLTTVGECSELITKGASPRWQGISYSDDRSQTLFITSENVREGYIDWTKEKYLDNKINEIQKRSILHYGDVLVNIVGASIGRAAIFDRTCLANTNQAVCIIRTNDNILNEYLCYFLNSPVALNYYDENKVETARANVSLADISHMPVEVPTVIEQQKIVAIISEIVDKETIIKQNAEQVLSQINTMKKAILARAFRGELGTNDPSEPPVDIDIS